MMGIVSWAQKKIRSKPEIDWGVEIESMVLEEGLESAGKWKVICRKVLEVVGLEGVSSGKLRKELDLLEKVLRKHCGDVEEGFWFREEDFAGYFKIFSDFLLLQCCGKVLEPIAVMELWEGVEEQGVSVKYEIFSKCILDSYFEYFLSSMAAAQGGAIQRVSRWDVERLRAVKVRCERFLHRVPHQEPSLLEGWLGRVRGWFWQLLEKLREWRPSELQGQRGLQALWALCKEFGELDGIQLEEARVFWEVFSGFSGSREIQIDNELLLAVAKFAPNSWFGNGVTWLEEVVRKDVETLRIWANALMLAAFVDYGKARHAGEDADIFVLVEAYKKIEQVLGDYRRRLYACRMKAAGEWGEKKFAWKDYLTQLDSLDDKLMAFEDLLVELERGSVGGIKGVIADEAVSFFCLGFEQFLSEEVRVLESAAEWGAVSCYCAALNEALLKVEMHRRRERWKAAGRGELFSAPDYFYMYHVFTQTDYAATQFGGVVRAVKKRFSKVHPDKHGGQLALAKYFTQKLNELCEAYERFQRAWKLSSFYASSPNERQVYTNEEWALYQEMEPIFFSEPKEGLGVGAVLLHRRYLQWIKGQANIKKFTDGRWTGIHGIYGGEDDLAKIEQHHVIRVVSQELQKLQKNKARRSQDNLEIEASVLAAQEEEARAKAESEAKDAEVKAAKAESEAKDAEVKAAKEEEARAKAESEAKDAEVKAAKAETEAKDAVILSMMERLVRLDLANEFDRLLRCEGELKWGEEYEWIMTKVGQENPAVARNRIEGLSLEVLADEKYSRLRELLGVSGIGAVRVSQSGQGFFSASLGAEQGGEGLCFEGEGFRRVG